MPVPSMVKNYQKNVIILTQGLSGSSVLSSLLAGAGYWVGDATYAKRDYDTYENSDLIPINRDILDVAGYNEDYQVKFNKEHIALVARAHECVDGDRLQAFLDLCDKHRPWLWKDPRLWLTIRVWKHWLDLDNISFIHLRRDPMQMWISTNLRRQVQSRRYCDAYGRGVDGSIREFLEGNRLHHMEMVYEDLIEQPERTLEELSGFLGLSLGLDDLQQVYKGDLYGRGKGLGSLAKAYLIYLKNYRERFDVR
jgi:hypothetical protein